jgi:hypothetical protein
VRLQPTPQAQRIASGGEHQAPPADAGQGPGQAAQVGSKQPRSKLEWRDETEWRDVPEFK